MSNIYQKHLEELNVQASFYTSHPWWHVLCVLRLPLWPRFQLLTCHANGFLITRDVILRRRRLSAKPLLTRPDVSLAQRSYREYAFHCVFFFFFFCTINSEKKVESIRPSPTIPLIVRAWEFLLVSPWKPLNNQETSSSLQNYKFGEQSLVMEAAIYSLSFPAVVIYCI